MIPRSSLMLTIGCLLCLSKIGGTNAFCILPTRVKLLTTTTTELFGRKRGNLGELADYTPSQVRKASRTKRKPTKSKTTKKSTKEASVSPALAEWMSKQDEDGGSTDTSATTTTTTTTTAISDVNSEDNETAATTFKPFKKGKKKEMSSKRREKQSERQAQQGARLALIDKSLETLEESLNEKGGDIDNILSSVKQLTQIPSGNLRQLVVGAKKQHYRLAWVGSDDAICHIGTGLHKVPLARLQEVFLTCLGKNRIEILEVIRILGPFPNVKNILQGTTKIEKGRSGDDDVIDWSVTVDSLVDGTGKEVSAGTEDNIRRYGLQVYFADERAIVAVVPPEEGYREDPFENNGSNVLVFVREENFDEKLDTYRVS